MAELTVTIAEAASLCEQARRDGYEAGKHAQLTELERKSAERNGLKQAGDCLRRDLEDAARDKGRREGRREAIELLRDALCLPGHGSGSSCGFDGFNVDVLCWACAVIKDALQRADWDLAAKPEREG
ncbi:MAG: hypothetical protein EPN91_02330 [Salinibacterium sp.]|nr:MAG: hypothetical protein EPN91_02330 [Salinibacterium sp.]